MLTDIFKGGRGKGDDITPSHSKIHALTPLLSVSTLTSSFSAALFPPKNKCDTILTLLSVSPKNMACLITPGRLVTPSRWSHHFFPKTRMPSPRAGLVVSIPCFLLSFCIARATKAIGSLSLGWSLLHHQAWVHLGRPLAEGLLTHQAGPEATTFSLQGRKPDHTRVVQGKPHSHRQQPT